VPDIRPAAVDNAVDPAADPGPAAHPRPA
jgi:hypothetical protein